MNENEMSDEELEEYEKQTAVVVDKWDKLELLRLTLNKSHLEKMYTLKRSTALGPLCPYYKKAQRLFIENQQKEIVWMLQELIKEFNNEG